MSADADLPEQAVTVVIAHPMRVWADALERLLSHHADIEVLTAHTETTWVRHAVVAQNADMLLLHADPPAAALGAKLRDFAASSPWLRVVVISESRDQELMNAAIRLGVRGWVTPTCSGDHLVRVLRGVHRGETWYPPALLTPVLDSLVLHGVPSPALPSLSDRELEIVSFLTQGLTRREIADRLSLSPHTVRTHIKNVLQKLDVHSTLAAVSIARQAGVGR